MQVVNELEEQVKSAEEKIEQTKIPALPFRPENKEVKPKPKEESKIFVPKKSKQDRRKEVKEWLAKKEKEENPNESEIIEKAEKISEEILNEPQEDYSEHDSTRLMDWLSQHLESVRLWLSFCSNPPITDDPIEADQIRLKIHDYENKGYMRDANQIVDYIEGLMYYAIYNENLFGEHNYLINDVIHPVKGYNAIYSELKKANNTEDKMRFLNKLVICAARPLAVAESFEKARDFEQSIADGGVMSREYRPYGEGDGTE